jgi:dual specificity tyrosine-phosphorylation-regulated kinase 2/3/4
MSDSWGVNSSPKKDLQEVKPEKNLPATRTTSSALQKMLSSKASMNAISNIRTTRPGALDLDKDDLLAEEEMKRLGSKRKETETAAKQLDALRKRATPKERVSPQQALHMASLNIYERGEIVDYKDIYFCGTNNAVKHVGEMTATAVNFGFDDERGDYSIVYGDHLLYRYEVIDVLGKGSFGQVVRCIDHKTGGLVAVKIIRNKKRFHQQALVEVNILKKLREWVSISRSPGNTSNTC